MKLEEAVQAVASAVLAVRVGEQLPTTTALARAAGTASGTVQTALRQLEAAGALHTSAHGSSGRRVHHKDLAVLWRASGRGPLTGVLPLPDSREFSGLATALTELADRSSLPLQLLFRQGSRTRAAALDSGRVDLVVMSAAAAQAMPLAVATLVLDPGTYYRPDSVVVITAGGAAVGRPRSVPVDRSSEDHVRLTRAEFPTAELIDTPYPFIPDAVIEGRFRAAVWHRTAASPLLVGSGLTLHPLRRRPSSELDPGGDAAALVWRAADSVVGGLVSDLLEPALLHSIQREVLDGVRTPRF